MSCLPLGRRGALTLVAVGATGTLLPRLVHADTAALLPGSDVCVLTPEVTEGPYVLDEGLVRRDITEGRPGVPVHLRLQVADARCRPLEGARVDLWHCDAQGLCSGFGGDNGTDSRRGETFLRGSQSVDARGVAEFDTIWPGWYRGRTAHMHVKVWLDSPHVLTAQIFFPDTLSQYFYENVPAYRREVTRDTYNGNDGIAQQATHASFAAVTETAESYLVQMILGIDPMVPSDAPQGRGQPTMPPGNGPRSGPPPGPPPGPPASDGGGTTTGADPVPGDRLRAKSYRAPYIC